jgi:hypothetical protein
MADWNTDEEFVIRCRMRPRWVPHFLAMLKKMEQYGDLGCSRMISFYADGDGDFRPKFKWPDACSCDAKPVTDEDGNVTFDAG